MIVQVIGFAGVSVKEEYSQYLRLKRKPCGVEHVIW